MVSYKLPSSFTNVPRRYAVFLSFRGEDTRPGFTSYLYEALNSKHIRTYIDDKSLQPGSFIATELLAAIEASTFAIVVLSSNFATSKWCLEEIVKIVDCEKRGILTIIPIFYYVDPSDVRHQRNSFEDAFTKHENDPTIVPQKVKSWRDALARVGEIAGVHVTQHRKEVEFVSEIVRNIKESLDATLPTAVPSGLVGIESRVNEVKRILLMESSDVRFIGLCGMSGVGKTTLAEVVYGAIQKEFQGSSFIENIKDVSKQSDCSSLCKLQQKLLDDILKDETIRVQNVTHGQTLLMTKLRDIKVLIVLDDVNHVDQLRYLAGGLEWFGNGSRVIVTTINMDLLKLHNVNEIYRCEEMNNDEALRLFIQSAFEHGPPTHVYEKWSDDIVKLAGGLPLALKVYGYLLYKKYWKDMLKKLREYPPEDVLGRLEVVFARLDSDQQEIFMHIACFLRGRNMDLVKDILTNIGLHADCGIPDLMNKFLITINHDDSVWMHDLLQQMCWEILRKKSHIYKGDHSAIKNFQDIVEVLLLKPKESRTIGIINQEKVEMGDSIDDPCCFSIMRRLKFLRITNIHFPQGLSYLSNDLRILEWFECSLKSLPSNFKPTHIYELEMCYSQLETLWEETLVFPNLRSIDLSYSKDLISIPDLTSTPKLVKLNLKGCTKLRELHESVLLQKSLQYVNVTGCTHLQSLGRSNIEMEALVTLLLSGCSNLEYIPEFGQNMKCLEHLYVDGTSIKKLPESLGELHNLRKLDASESSIEELPLSIRCLKKLRLLRAQRCPFSSQNKGFLFTSVDILSNIRELDLSYCNLTVVPDGIGLLHRLISLDLSGNNIEHLSASISLLSNLKMLCLNNCKRLQSLPKLSLVNEDTLYGLQVRFSYIMTGKEVDMSTFHATSNNTSPTVSCLNCPRLAENESGTYLAERVLNSYLQLRTKYWMTPEAVFEIVGAGSKIPSKFRMKKSDEILCHYGQWVGMAICAVIGFRHTDANMETKYVVTAHIHHRETLCKIPVPVNLVPGLENQLVFYWTAANDLQRMVNENHKNTFRVSLSVEPRDGNLLVTKFGVCFIHDEEIQQLKKYEDSTNKVARSKFKAAMTHTTYLKRGSKSDHINLEDTIHSKSITSFISFYRRNGYSLHKIHQIINSLLKINQEVFKQWKKEWSEAQFLFPLIYDYYRISRETSKLYTDFIRLLKDILCSWMSVKLALKQILVKSTANNYSNREMLQQLSDLEAAKSVMFSNMFVTSLANNWKQTVLFSRCIKEETRQIRLSTSVMLVAKLSRMTIAGILSLIAGYYGNSWEFKSLDDGWHGIDMNDDYDRELQIQDFHTNADLLLELNKKMEKPLESRCVTERNKEEIKKVINKLEKNINGLTETIEDMSNQAFENYAVILDAGIILNQFMEDNKLQVTESPYGKRPLELEEEEVVHARKIFKLSSGYDSIELGLGFLDLTLVTIDHSSNNQRGLSSDDSDSSSLIHSIGRDNSIWCLLKRSRSTYGSLALLNSNFRDLIRSGELYRLRRKNGIIEHWVYISCHLDQWEAFDPINQVWMHLPTMSSNTCFKYSDKESLAVGTELLVLGKEVRDHVIYKYSLLTDSWSLGQLMNEPRCLFGSASLGEIAIVAGGIDRNGKIVNSAELYNSESGSWETLPNMLKPRKMCSGVFMDNKFYVIGGVGGTDSRTLTCGEEYDLATRVWTEIPNMSPNALAEAPLLVAVVDNELYAADCVDMEVRKYDKHRKKWETVGRLPELADSMNGWGIAFSSCGDRVIVIDWARTSGDGFIEVNSWVPRDSPPRWTMLGRKQSSNFVYNYAMMGC